MKIYIEDKMLPRFFLQTQNYTREISDKDFSVEYVSILRNPGIEVEETLTIDGKDELVASNITYKAETKTEDDYIETYEMSVVLNNLFNKLFFPVTINSSLTYHNKRFFGSSWDDVVDIRLTPLQKPYIKYIERESLASMAYKFFNTYIGSNPKLNYESKVYDREHNCIRISRSQSKQITEEELLQYFLELENLKSKLSSVKNKNEFLYNLSQIKILLKKIEEAYIELTAHQEENNTRKKIVS